MNSDAKVTAQEQVCQSDDDSSHLSSSSIVSDDSGIEDWIDDMTIEIKPPVPLEEKMSFPLQNVDDQKLIENNSKMPVEDCCDNVFPALPLPDVQPVTDFKIDVPDENGVSGACGLYNLGNTCFMNSALQCLLATPIIKNLLSGDLKNTNSPIDSANFIERLQEVFQKISMGKYSVLCPDGLHSSISRLHLGFGDFKQHDSQEFVSFVLNVLHDHLNNSLASENNVASNRHDNNNDNDADELSENITGEVSKRLKMDHSVSMETEADAGVECEETMSKATCAWKEYSKKNQSVIAERFHGQFQNVITCEKCAFVSTTHEPFMFLSLPIPYAMEKQIVVTLVSSPKINTPHGMLAVKRYLVTVSKNGLAEDMKRKFFAVLKNEDCHVNTNDFVFAEVKNHANVRILDDKTQLKYLSASCSVYTVEVVSLTKQTEQNGSASNDQGTTVTVPNVNIVSKWHSCSICFEEKFEEEMNVHHQCNGIMCSTCLVETLKFTKNDNGDFPCPTCGCYISESSYEPMVQKDEEKAPTENSEQNGSETVLGTASKWYTCSICLEETFDDDIRSHLQCGGIICTGCLSTMTGFYGSKEFSCPTCNRNISDADYVKITNKQNKTKVIRQVLVPVLFRYKNNELENVSRKFELFGHPFIMCLLSEVMSQDIIDFSGYLAERFNLHVDYNVVVTDGSGLSCGLCDVTSSCTGCRVKDHESIQLKPGCCIAMEFEGKCDQVISTLNFCKDDDSLKTLRDTDVVTLHECIQKFSDVELLTEENPWFCPRCQANQVSTKLMAVTRWPEILIVHLKRFHYEGAQGNKISCPIDYPLSGLNVDILTCADSFTDSLKTSPVEYNLYGCINHVGSLFGGHYTAFTNLNSTMEESNVDSHPQWYYFNDETFIRRSPPEDTDYRNEAYVLFYQLKAHL